MRELTPSEVEFVSGGNPRDVAVGAGQLAGLGLGYGICLPCGGFATTMTMGLTTQLGGQAAGYMYDNPGPTLTVAVGTLHVADTVSSFVGMLGFGSPIGDAGSPAACW